jgi:hypothetical protein
MESDAKTECDADDAARRWARSGAMALTGRSDGACSVAPAAVAVAADRAAAALRGAARRAGVAIALDGAALLGERAACAGLHRAGRTSVGGSARLVRAADGWLAINLPRADDRAALPAWLACDAAAATEPWSALAQRLRERTARELVERARLLGLAVSEAAPPGAPPEPAVGVERCGAAAAARPTRPGLVVDLSALWAGPLCAQLLGACGARVVKVESTRRPDGARFGPAAFFDRLNAGKESVALDLTTSDGVAALRRLLRAADVVVESARPRALAQLGIEAAAEIAARAGAVWVSITGYGRAAPCGDWVAFGDDAAAAAGLAALAGRDDDGPLFCADAVADPLAGLSAAAAALEAWQAGGGVLLDVSLFGVAAHAVACAAAPDRWCGAVAPPRARPLRGRARPLGADTRSALASLSGRPVPCR